jgi:uncharacterized oligopeptide transporter (OPT) family protein
MSTPNKDRAAPELTLRAALVGVVIGAVMCLSNLYVFFKAGWSMGVTVTAAVLAFVVFRGLWTTGIAKRPLGALENNVLTTVASGAGYMTGGGNMAAFGALLMVAADRPSGTMMMLWFGAIAALGVFVAIPIKRQLIDVEQLVFPTGTATAETIKALHAGDFVAGATAAEDADAAVRARREGMQKSAALGVATGIAAAIAILRDAVGWLGAKIPLGFSIAGKAAAEWTLSIKTEVVLVGAGALMSFRTAWSILFGGLFTYAWLAPSLYADGLVKEVSFKGIVEWTVWPGAAMLVGAGVTSFLLDGKSVARALSGMVKIVHRGAKADEDPRECPDAWFPIGFIVLAPIVVFLMTSLFNIPWWAGAIAAPLSILMGFVAARVTGDTDVTPTKALGPVTQLLYGVMVPGNLAGNIMSANVTGGVGLHAADLLTTLKTGKLLGGSARAQFFAQLIGVAAGAALVVPAFFTIIPDVNVLGTDEWPAPACMVWKGVSQAFAGGAGSLGAEAKTAAMIAFALGIALALLEKFAPKPLKAWIPAPSGLGIAMVVPGANAISMFLGGAVAEGLRRFFPKLAARYTTAAASGLIAGESLAGVAVAAIKASS